MLVNTDSSSGDAKLEIEDEVKVEAPEDGGLFVPQDEPVVKSEAGDDATMSDEMQVDTAPMGDLQAGADAASPSTVQETPKPAPETAPQRPSEFLAANSKKPVLQTEEDKQEYERHLEDIDILARELGGMSTTQPPKTGADTEGDVAMGEEAPVSLDHKEGRLYLFQFPPILPKLSNVEQPVKQDPGDVDVQLSDIPSGTIDLDDTPEVKAEPAAEADADVPRPTSGSKVKDALVQEPGLIGKLVVRRSGKVELSWGGTSLALGRGAEFDFLTTGVVVQGLGAEKGAEGGEEMSGTGMGRVMGKIVATPDWEKMF
jgi:DNA-directed RNA polymerase III subunit RPC4